jgi:diacylglycerol O-acyltransferase / wax synthase
VREAMDGLKESKQAVGAATLTAVNNLAPPTVLAQASRLNFSTRLFNLIVTNIPGPQFPLYVLGRELKDLLPVAFLPEHHALAIAIMSYNGGIDYGLLGDFDALPDIEVIATGIDASLQALLDAARGETAPRPANRPAVTEHNGPSPSPIVPTTRQRAQRGPAADMRAKRARGSRPTRNRQQD